MKSTMHYQCRLRNMAATETVTWIPEPWARVGNVLPESFSEGGWIVVTVYTPGIAEESLKAKQMLDRHSLPSIKNVIPDKPRKRNFKCMGDFMRASAQWAEIYNQWPYAGSKDEDDDYYFVVNDNPNQQSTRET